MRLPDEAVDAWRFERLLHDAREVVERRPDSARRLLGEALSLWQGPAYAEFADEPWARDEIARLDELRLVAREVNVAAGLRSADVAATVPEAQLLTREARARARACTVGAGDGGDEYPGCPVRRAVVVVTEVAGWSTVSSP